MNEFELIRRYFGSRAVFRDDIIVGIGDDAAVTRVPADMELVTTTDMLVVGTHFLEHTPAAAVGHKALAVNLSDLAAMGAKPAWFTLSLSLPAHDEDWLLGFSAGLFALAAEYGIALIGGDTVRGPLSVAIHAIGLVPAGGALLRSGAKRGDRIYVTGSLGDAALGLQVELGRTQVSASEREKLIGRLHRPVPQVALGIGLRGIAGAVIDISDGLSADLVHILEASHVGARVLLERLPLSAAYRMHQETVGWNPALAGGEDYELCFTVSPDRVNELDRLQTGSDCALTCIGEIEEESGLRVIDPSGGLYQVTAAGYDHFSD